MLTEKDQFVHNLVTEKNQALSRLSMEKKQLVGRLRDEYSFNQDKLAGEMDTQHQ